MMVPMPLSEREQRILRQIEQELAADPTFVDRASRLSKRRMIVLAVCLVLLLGVTVLALSVNYWMAFAAFAATFWVGVMLEREVRVIGRDRLSHVSVNAWLTGARGRGRRT
jgi:hypothetical protein